MSSTKRGGKRSEADFYETPAYCVERLLEAIDLPGGPWLEPAAGNGAIARVVSRLRSDVRWSFCELREECTPDLKALQPTFLRIGDFFDGPFPSQYPDPPKVIITNPPFSLAERYLAHCLGPQGGAEYAIFLLRLNFIESKRRYRLMSQKTPDLYVLPDRPAFTGQGTDSITYAWFAFDRECRQEGKVRLLRLTPQSERKRPVSVETISQSDIKKVLAQP